MTIWILNTLKLLLILGLQKLTKSYLYQVRSIKLTYPIKKLKRSESCSSLSYIYYVGKHEINFLLQKLVSTPISKKYKVKKIIQRIILIFYVFLIIKFIILQYSTLLDRRITILVILTQTKRKYFLILLYKNI